MLRISTINRDGCDCIRLEGKLLQPWVDEVARLFPRINSAQLPQLDLSRVTYVDTAGVELLRSLLERGVLLDAFTPYVAELLHLPHTHSEHSTDG